MPTIDDVLRKGIADRKPQPPETLAVETVQWLAGLPADVRPRRLPILFPRIANRLGSRWSQRQTCLACLDDLLIDKRGTRRGFPLDIVVELAALKNYFETVLHSQPQTVWDEVAERRRAN